MAVKSTTTDKSTAATPDAAPAVEASPTRAPGECVVDEAFHVGRAVNGLVCSYHAMRYKADGTPR